MRKLSKTLSYVVLALAATTVQADWMADGTWLVGAQAGYSWREHGDFDVAITTVAPLATTIVDSRIKDRGFTWGLLGGYQAKSDQWLLGLELNVNWYPRHRDHVFSVVDGLATPTIVTANMKQRVTAGLSARIGYDINWALLPYLRAGIETSRNRLNVTAFDATTGTLLSAEGSRRSYHGVFGVGLEMPMPSMDCFTVRLEYDYHTKGRRTTVTAPTVGPFAYTASARQPMHVGLLSLVWNF